MDELLRKRAVLLQEMKRREKEMPKIVHERFVYLVKTRMESLKMDEEDAKLSVFVEWLQDAIRHRDSLIRKYKERKNA